MILGMGHEKEWRLGKEVTEPDKIKASSDSSSFEALQTPLPVSADKLLVKKNKLVKIFLYLCVAHVKLSVLMPK